MKMLPIIILWTQKDPIQEGGLTYCTQATQLTVPYMHRTRQSRYVVDNDDNYKDGKYITSQIHKKMF